MHRRHHYEMDMCSGTLLPKIIRFTLPLVLTGVAAAALQCRRRGGGGTICR